MNKLAEELKKADYAGLTDQQCFDLLTTRNITVKTSIETHDIQKYLMLKGKLLAIESSDLLSAKTAVRAMELFNTFDISDAEIDATLTGTLDALIADSLIDANDKTAILSMGESLKSKAEIEGLGRVLFGHIARAKEL